MGIHGLSRLAAVKRHFLLACLALFLAATGQAHAAPAGIPAYAHVLVVILENHSFNQIFERADAPYLRKLAKGGAVFTRSYGVRHPSQPNYLALFSGSTHGVSDDNPHDLAGPNLASSLVAAGKSFAGYIEVGSPRKHNPWESFAGAAAFEKPLSAFPSRFDSLPSVAFVIPNLTHDMHDGTVGQADTWLEAHLGGYAQWAKGHNSLLIVTFDESDDASDQRILTLLYGAGIRPGQYAEKIDHYAVLRTIEAIEGVQPLGKSAGAGVIKGPWR